MGMATLGKCLLFWLKYPAEMERLYEAEEPDVNGLPNADRVLEKVIRVGDAARREAAALLESCAPRIDDHLRTISTAQRGRNSLENTWDLRFWVAPRTAPARRFQVGVYLHSHRAALIPWVWCQGGRRAEDGVVRILGRGVKAAALEFFSPGGVGLAEIKIPLLGQLDEPVACEPLVAGVQQAVEALTEQHVMEIAAVAGGREES
jgi:hypothetical protein